MDSFRFVVWRSWLRCGFGDKSISIRAITHDWPTAVWHSIARRYNSMGWLTCDHLNWRTFITICLHMARYGGGAVGSLPSPPFQQHWFSGGHWGRAVLGKVV